MLVKQLTAKIGADIKDFDKAMKGMSAKFAKHSEKFKKVGKGMTIAGAAIIGTVGLMMKKYGEAGDAVHKMALRTGFSTEALSELKYAAEISGTSLATLEKGIKKMASSIGEANLGLKTYTDAFELIGMDVKELAGLKPEEQFFKMADGIASIVDPTERAYAAQKLLGRAGTELLPLFAEGVDGMEALRKKAKELGYSFDQEAADGAARLMDAQTTLKTSVAGLGISISQNLAPALSTLIEKFADTIGKVSTWIKEHPKLTEIIAKAVLGLGVLLAVLGPLMMMLPGIIAAFPAIAIGIKLLLGPIGLVIAAAGVAYKVISDLTKAKEKMIEADYRAFEAEHNLSMKLRDIADAAGYTRKEFIELTRKYGENTNALAFAINRGDEGVELQKAMQAIGVERVKQQKEMNEEVYGGGLDLEGYNKALSGVTDKTETWVEYLKTLGITTILEKEKRVKLLKDHIEKLDQAYKDSEITLEAHKEATKKAKEEIEGVSTVIIDTAIPASRDLTTAMEDYAQKVKEKYEDMEGFVSTYTDTINQYTLSEADYKELKLQEWYDNQVDLLKESLGDTKEYYIALGLLNDAYALKTEDLTEVITIQFRSMSERINDLFLDMGDAFGGFAMSLMTKGSDMGDALKGLWTDIGNSFKSLVADYIADEAKKLLLSVATSTTEMATTVTSGLSSIGPAISGIASGIAGLITTLATAIATAATTLAAAAPALLIVLGIALAAYAGFKLISSLFKKKPKTGTMEAILRDVAYVFLHAICLKLDGLNDHVTNFFPKIDYMNSILAKIENILKGVRTAVKSMNKKFGELTGFAEGTTYVPRTQMAVVHAGETITPPAGRAGGGVPGGQGAQNVYVNVNISAMDTMGVDEFMRNRGIPAIVDAIKINHKQTKTNMRKALEG